MKLQIPHWRPAAPGAARAGRAPLWAAALAWLAAGAALVWWGLMFFSGSAWQPVPVAAAAVAAADPAAVARALGHQDRPADARPSANPGPQLRLAGVVAQPGERGAALIAVDGQPPRPFLVGSPVGDAWVLRAVERRKVWLAPAQGGEGELELVAPPSPAE